MKKMLTILISMSLSFNGFTKTESLISEDNSIKVEVEKVLQKGKVHYRFLLINNDIHPDQVCLGDLLECHRTDLGAGHLYTKEEINSILKSEKTEAYIKSVAAGVTAIAAIVGLAYLGVLGGMTAATSMGAAFFSSGTYVGTAIGGVLGGFTGLTLPTWFKKLNPWTQFKQANVMSNYNFMDQDIISNREHVLEVAVILHDIFKANTK
jgi:hypothetical protein